MGCVATIGWYWFAVKVLGFHARLAVIVRVGFGSLTRLVIVGAIIWWIASATLG